MKIENRNLAMNPLRQTSQGQHWDISQMLFDVFGCSYRHIRLIPLYIPIQLLLNLYVVFHQIVKYFNKMCRSVYQQKEVAILLIILSESFYVPYLF